MLRPVEGQLMDRLTWLFTTTLHGGMDRPEVTNFSFRIAISSHMRRAGFYNRFFVVEELFYFFRQRNPTLRGAFVLLMRPDVNCFSVIDSVTSHDGQVNLVRRHIRYYTSVLRTVHRGHVRLVEHRAMVRVRRRVGRRDVFCVRSNKDIIRVGSGVEENDQVR